MQRNEQTVFILYKNYQNFIGVREIQPLEWYYGNSKYHPEPQWLLRAYDFEKQEERSFAVKDIRAWWDKHDVRS